MGPHGSRAGVMAKENRGGSNGWMQVLNELLKTDIYKRSQGRIVRQFTCRLFVIRDELRKLSRLVLESQ